MCPWQIARAIFGIPEMTFEPETPPTPIPVIAPEDYAAFRGILRESIPQTFEEWSEQVRAWENKYPKSTKIKVTPQHFQQHLNQTHHAPTLNELLVYADEVRGQQ